MAAKKMPKKTEKDDGSWKAQAKFKAWVLIILGLLGLLQAVGYINLSAYYFPYAWALIVIIIGAMKLWYLHSEDC